MTRDLFDRLLTRVLAATFLALLALCIVSAWASGAYAATATTTNAAVDFSVVVAGFILPTLQGIVLGVMGWAFAWVAKHKHLQVSATNQTFLENAIAIAIASVQATLQPSEQISAPAQIAAIANIVLTEAPKAVAFLKVTPASLATLIVNRLPA